MFVCFFRLVFDFVFDCSLFDSLYFFEVRCPFLEFVFRSLGDFDGFGSCCLFFCGRKAP